MYDFQTLLHLQAWLQSCDGPLATYLKGEKVLCRPGDEVSAAPSCLDPQRWPAWSVEFYN
jgi:hypothetical protein